MSGQPLKILAISFRMPPMLSPRSIQVHRLLTHWARMGHEIDVICGDPNTAVWFRWDEDLVKIYTDFILYHRVPSSEARRFRFYDFLFRKPLLKNKWLQKCLKNFQDNVESIPDLQYWWGRKARKAAVEIMKRSDFDIIISFGSPMSDHLIGRKLKKLSGLPWIAHFSDPWVDNPYKTFSSFARSINAKQERQVVSEADQVFFVSEETRRLVMKKYPSDWWAKTHVIPHYFDSDLYPKPTSRNSKVIFRHLGTFYLHRTPDPLFRALDFLKSQDSSLLENTLFEMVGACIPAGLVDRLCHAYNLEDYVNVRPTVSYLDSLKLMKEAEVLILMDAPIIDPNVFLPCKLVDYLGAGRAILGITPLEGPSADLIRNTGGIVVDPRDIKGIANAIRTCVREFQEGVLFQKRVPDETIKSTYEVTTVARNFIDKLLQTAKGQHKDVIQHPEVFNQNVDCEKHHELLSNKKI